MMLLSWHTVQISRKCQILQAFYMGLHFLPNCPIRGLHSSKGSLWGESKTQIYLKTHFIAEMLTCIFLKMEEKI